MTNLHQQFMGNNAQNLPHTYFVDETGDGVIFDGKGHLLLGTGKVQNYFILGMVECETTERYRPTELYDSAVRRLFDKKLHTHPAFEVIFASRGRARTQALREHLLHAQVKSRKAAGTFPDAMIHVKAMPSHQHAGLQLVDYCLWALQRVFTKEEDRFLSLIWPKIGLIVNADDTSENPYGTNHTSKRTPLTPEGIKKRKVED